MINQVAEPQCRYGKIVLEFFQNDDETFKLRALKGLAKEVRKELNISCLHAEENMLTNPERGTLIFSFAAAHPKQAGELQNRLLEFIDKNAPGRIVLEEIETIDF